MPNTQVPYEYNDYYSSEELGDEIASLRPRGPEGRTTWVYLGLLGVVFLFLVLFSWACDNDRDLPDVENRQGEIAGTTEVPVSLTLTVDVDIVTIEGSVPDENTQQRLVALVGQFYDQARLIDSTAVAENVILDSGSIRVTGVTADDDPRPDQAKNAIIDEFGFDDGGTELQRPEEVRQPVNVEIQLATDSVQIRGQVPDQASIDVLVNAVGGYWAGEAVDATGLEISDRSTWDQGVVRLTGPLPPEDSRYLQLSEVLRARLGESVTVDISQLAPDSSPEALATVQQEIDAMMEANPILFNPQSAEIQEASDQTLSDVAVKLNSVLGANVEIIGHTDDRGDADENQTLSVERAQAVAARLISLGVAETRITTSGLGETSPLIDEQTDEARSKNRRIEFKLSAAG